MLCFLIEGEYKGMSENKDNFEKKGFFYKMKTNENRGFEISMFAISVILALAVVITGVWIGIYFYNANASKITDANSCIMANERISTTKFP